MINLINHIENKLYNLYKRHNRNGYLNILIAASGGIDSMVLVDIMVKLYVNFPIKLGIIHVNHNLRNESFKDEIICRNLCNQHKLKFYSRELNPQGIKNQSLEAWGREKRYIFFNQIATKYNFDWIFTAHHQDDQIETMIMKNQETDDAYILSGIREQWKNIYRPLLEVSKSNIYHYAQLNNVHWNEDSTNNNIKYLRNRIRHTVIPKLKSINPNYKKTILSKIHINQKKAIKISKRIKEVDKSKIQYYDKNLVVMDFDIFSNENKLFIKYVLKYCCTHYFDIDVKITQKQLQAFQSFFDFSKMNTSFPLGNEITCYKYKSHLMLYKITKCFSEKIKFTQNSGFIKWGSGYFTFEKCLDYIHSHSKKSISIPTKDLQQGFYVRNWNFGDKIVINKNGNSKKLSKLFNENKILPFNKNRIPVIVDKSDNIVWVPNVRHATKLKFRKGSQEFLKVTWHEKSFQLNS